MNTDNENLNDRPHQADRPAPGRRAAVTGAIVLGLLVAGGIGAAIAVGVGNDDDVIGRTSQATGPSSPADPSAVPTPADADGTDVDGMIAAMQSARSTVPGVVVQVESRSNGAWEIEIFDGSSRESTVLVDDDGPRVVDTDDDDDDHENAGEGITDDLARQIVTAATSDTTGTVIKIELEDDDDDDDDDDERYTVKVRTASGSVVELDLNRNLDVVDRDDD